MTEHIVEVTVKLRINSDESELETILENMDYDFRQADDADGKIVDTEITGWEIK